VYQPIHIEGGVIIGAIGLAFGLLGFGGVIVGAILVSPLMESKAKEASAVAVVRSGQAQQDVALAKHDIQTIQRELKKRGIDIPVN
jgi:hypothetical protein